MTESQKLLANYARTGSEECFTELLRRYTDLVYSAAVRLLNGDAHLAKDVTQTVFIDFAKKARNLPRETTIGGWLHHHTVFVAATTLRGERRRQFREKQAVEMNALQDHTEANLAQVSPVLDEAICELNSEDRTAVMLRFFEQLDFRSMGQVLDSTEEAARKRVARALEKLQLSLKRRGVTVSAAALGTALASEAVTSAPAGLAASLAATTSTISVASGKFLSLAPLVKAGIATGLVAAAVGIPLFTQHRSQGDLNQQHQLLDDQKSQLAEAVAENVRLSNLLAQVMSSSALNADRERELLRLRSKVGQLRGLERQVEELKAQNNRLAAERSLNSSTQEQIIYLAGEFRKPGQYHWTNGMTLSNLFELGGGITDWADRSIIRVKEPGSEEQRTIDYGGRSIGGSWLRPGVVVFVPRSINPAEIQDK